jgi:hypothetical protein
MKNHSSRDCSPSKASLCSSRAQGGKHSGESLLDKRNGRVRSRSESILGMALCPFRWIEHPDSSGIRTVVWIVESFQAARHDVGGVFMIGEGISLHPMQNRFNKGVKPGVKGSKMRCDRAPDVGSLDKRTASIKYVRLKLNLSNVADAWAMSVTHYTGDFPSTTAFLIKSMGFGCAENHSYLAPRKPGTHLGPCDYITPEILAVLSSKRLTTGYFLLCGIRDKNTFDMRALYSIIKGTFRLSLNVFRI